MKVTHALIGALAVASIAAVSSSAIAARPDAPDIGYYSDAAMTHMVGEVTYGCAGGHSQWGNTSTPYHKVIFDQPCSGGGKGGGGAGCTWFPGISAQPGYDPIPPECVSF